MTFPARPFLLCCCFLLLLGHRLHGQYRVVKLNTSGKRFAPAVSNVAEDSKGLIWYLTYDGLYRYDGQRSVALEGSLDKLGFKGTPSDMLLENDRLWLVGQGKLGFLDIRDWKLVMAPQAMLAPGLADEVRDIELLPNGKVAVGYKSGYVILADKNGFVPIESIAKNARGSNAMSYQTATFWKNHYWIATDHGHLFQLDTAGIIKQDTQLNGAVTTLIARAEDLVLKVIDGAIYCYNGRELTEELTSDLAKLHRENRWHELLVPVSGGYVYVNKRGMNNKEFRFISAAKLKSTLLYRDDSDMLGSTTVNGAVYRPETREVILGTSQGVFVLYPEIPLVPQFNPVKAYGNTSVRGMYKFSNGDIFFASYSGCGLVSKEKLKLFEQPKYVYSMAPLPNGKLLLGLEGGFLAVFDHASMRFDSVRYHVDEAYRKILPRFVFTIARNGGDFYLGTENGVWILNLQKALLHPLIDGRGKPVTGDLQIRKLHCTKDSLYVASQKGLFLWHNARLEKVFPANPGHHEVVYDLVADRQGFWLATQKDGIVQISTDGAIQKLFNTNNGKLSTNVVFSLLKVGDTILGGTDHGLAVVGRNFVRMITGDEGLQQREFNHGAAYFDQETETAYLGGLNGYTVLEMKRGDWLPSPTRFPLYISQVHASGREQGDVQDIYYLPYNPRATVTIVPSQEYLSVSVATPMNYLVTRDLEYRLEKLSPDWHPLEEGQQISLIGLPAGNYVLNVRPAGSNHQIEWIQLSVHKEAPFYETWWFRVAVLLLILLIALLIYRARISSVRRKAEFRTKISSDLHDEVGSMLTAIALQADLLVYRPGADSQNYLKKIAASSREAIATMSDIIWSIDARNDHLSFLTLRMNEYLAASLGVMGVEYQFDSVESSLEISQQFRQNLYLIFKEAINNICKHSGATFVKISCEVQGDQLILSIEDNGRGMQKASSGQGLANMKMRAKQLRGELTVAQPGTGTMLVLRIPLKRRKT